MLERTAAKLDPCALPRSLQSTIRPSRKLHTGFWQHGAAAIDLSTQCAYPGHDNDTRAERHEPQSQTLPDQLVASAFLFDFLYPRGTVAFLRRLVPGTAERLSHLTSRHNHAALRSFTSSAHGAMFAAESPSLARDHITSYNPGAPLQTFSSTDGVDGVGSSAPSAPSAPHLSIAHLQNIVDPQAPQPLSPLELLNGLMDRTDTEFYASVWDLWNLLAEGEKTPQLRKDIIAYLYRSPNIREADRILQLFSEVDVSEWSPSQLRAAVAAHVQRGDSEQAFELYKSGLEDDRAFVAGLGHLLHQAFRVGDWGLVCRIWYPRQQIEARDMTSDAESHSKLPLGDLKPLLAIPDLGGRVLELEDFLAQRTCEISSDSVADTEQEIPAHYHTLLSVLARLAIQQPCKAERALPLIRLAGGRWFPRYLMSAIYRGDTSAVGEVYREYRRLPRSEFRPYIGLLRGVFDVLREADDAIGLEMLHEDWDSTCSLSVDQHGQERFMGFYASRGDVRAVQRIWHSYVHEHAAKEVLKKPSTFNYLLLAHSNRGNLKMVRQIFDEMTEKYHIQPDIISWNILLKTLASLRQYDQATETFEQLCEAMEPSSVTFGTMMSMHGSRGDIDAALRLRDMARNLQVQATTVMVSGIIQAYCYLDRFDDAKAYCINYSQMEMSGDRANPWNCLIRYKAHKRDINGVNEVIRLMQDHGVVWNRATDEAILHALTLCKKTPQAYHYLLKAAEAKRLPLTERHYAAVLKAAWRTRSWPTVTGVSNMMRKAGISPSAHVQLGAAVAALSPSLSRQDDINGEPDRTAENQMSDILVGLFRDYMSARKQESVPPAEAGKELLSSSASPAGFFDEARYVHQATATLALLGDAASIRQLLDMYFDNVDASPEDLGSLPVPILESMMQADLLENKFDKVKQTWKVVFEKTIQSSQSSKPGVILPRHRQSLSLAFSLVHRALDHEEDSSEAMALVEQVYDAGFTLSGLQWNHICLSLAKKGEWVRACQICEEKLMPGWHLWRAQRITDEDSPNRLSLPVRLAGNVSGSLRANTYNLGYLTDMYYALRRDALFDETAQREIAHVKATCPKVMYAFRTALGHSDNGFITQGGFHKKTHRRSRSRGSGDENEAM